MLNVVIVGLGGMGIVHFKNYKHIDDVNVVGFVDQSNKSKNKAKELGLPIYETITEVCQNENVDVIDVCTPTFLHSDHVKEALENNKNVICEKPLALNSKDARALFTLAKEKNLHLYVAQVVQFTKQTEILREIVEDERFGKPLDAIFERLSSKPDWGSDSWTFDKEKAGLIPFDLHIHDLDMIVSLFDKPDKVEVQKARGVLDFPEFYRFIYEYNDLNVIGEAAWFNAQIPFTARWRIYFEKAYLVNDEETLIAYLDEGEAIEFNVEEEVKIETGLNVPATGMYLNELNHFVDCIKKDIDSSIVTSEQVINTIEILESIS